MRSGDAGQELPSRDVVVTVPNVVAGATGDVANALTDAAFASAAGVPYSVQVEILGAPIANMAAPYAWVANPVTGQISMRFMAGTGAIATADRTFRIRRTT